MIVSTNGNFEILKKVSGEYIARLKTNKGHVLFVTDPYQTLEEIEVVINIIRRLSANNTNVNN